jgi:hypothetical protein
MFSGRHETSMSFISHLGSGSVRRGGTVEPGVGDSDVSSATNPRCDDRRCAMDASLADIGQSSQMRD